jgi:hypothetical protein
VDLRLRIGVGLEAAVPVDVIRRDVHQHGDRRMERPLDGELEARHLDDEDLSVLACRLGEGQPDVAAREGVVTARSQAGLDHGRDRRLAVRAGDGEVRDTRQTGAELHLAPDGEIAGTRPRHHLGVGRDPRPDDHQGGVLEVARVVSAGPYVDPEPAELRDRRHVALGTGFRHEHPRALRGKHTRGARPGDARTDDDRPLPREPSAQSRPPRAMKSA